MLRYGAWSAPTTGFSVLYDPCIKSGSQEATTDTTGAGVLCCRMSKSCRLVVEVLAKHMNYHKRHCHRTIHVLAAYPSVDNQPDEFSLAAKDISPAMKLTSELPIPGAMYPNIISQTTQSRLGLFYIRQF